jgi:hypothetical protein
VVAPSARIVITALDGGVLDNAEINQFLETVHLTDTSGALLSSTLLSVQLLNALTITAVDAQGAASAVTVGSVVNANALNSLDGPDPAAAPAETASLIGGWEAEDVVAVPEEAASFAARFDGGFRGDDLALVERSEPPLGAVEIADFTEDRDSVWLPDAEPDALAPAAGSAFSAGGAALEVATAPPPPPTFEEEAITVHA